MLNGRGPRVVDALGAALTVSVEEAIGADRTIVMNAADDRPPTSPEPFGAYIGK